MEDPERIDLTGRLVIFPAGAMSGEGLLLRPSEKRGQVTMENECSKGRRFVLIAEDDEDDRMLYRFALGHFTTCVDFSFVGNGKELIEHLNCHDSLPDLILLDLNMPTMDGRQALKIIRSHARFKNIPVVCNTTFSSASDLQFCHEHGAGCFTKPDGMPEFSGLVQSQIGVA